MMASDPRATVSLPGSSGREFDIDFFRGFVCVCLIYLHFYTLGLIEYWNRIFGSNLEFIVWNFRLGVESFFVLAGLMMAHMLRPAPGEDVSLGLYLKRRFYRLIIPYWVAVLLATADRWAIYLLFKRGGSDVPTLGDTISQLLLLQEVYHHYYPPPSPPYSRIGEAGIGYWSMVTLEQFYLIWLAVYALVRWLVTPGKSVGTYGRCEWVMALLTLIGGLASATVIIGNWQTDWRMARFGIYLSLGMLLYRSGLDSRNDFQRCDLVAFESEEESEIHGAAGKVAGEPAGDDDLPVLLFARERLARVLVLGRGIRFPLFDRGPALVGVPLVFHDGRFCETPGNGLAIEFVGGEKGGDGRWQIE
jgi:peptidoglycan/LPS O-acetylase OafA/YrhL